MEPSEALINKISRIMQRIVCECPYEEYSKRHTVKCLRDHLPYEYYSQPDLKKYFAEKQALPKTSKGDTHRYRLRRKPLPPSI